MLNNKTWILLALALPLVGCVVTSKPLTHSERVDSISTELETLFADQEPISGAITVAEAIARAIKYNLDNRVTMMEHAVALRHLDMAKLDLLPQLAVSAGYFDRSNDSGAASQSLLTGELSLEPSTSQERQRNTSDLTVAWNVLDFGVSYATAKQRHDEIRITEERRRKVIQNIVQDVLDAYWRAWNAQELLPEMDKLIRDTEETIEQSRALADKGAQNKKQALRYQRNLLEIRSQLWQSRERMALAKISLSRLMNLPSGADFRLADPGDLSPPASLLTPLDELEHSALADHPDLREQDYQLRVTRLDIRKAMLRMLPGIEIDFGTRYDSNKFLFNNDWSDLGLKISLNLLNVFGGLSQKQFHEARFELVKARRIALAMAALARVRLAAQRYALARQRYNAAADLAQVDDLLLRMELSNSQTQTKFDVIQARAVAVSTKIRKHLSYAETQKALARIFNSIGADPLPEAIASRDLEHLSKAVEEHWNRMTLKHLETATDDFAPKMDLVVRVPTRVAIASTSRRIEAAAVASKSTPRRVETAAVPSTSTPRRVETAAVPSTNTPRRVKTDAVPSTSSQWRVKTAAVPRTSTPRRVETDAVPGTQVQHYKNAQTWQYHRRRQRETGAVNGGSL